MNRFVIRVDWFIASLALGLFIVYVWNPPPQVVVKFPSPHNAGHVVYRNKEHECFKYRAKKVNCPSNNAVLKPQPVALEDFQTKDSYQKYTEHQQWL
jgi:hypothetical protein